MRWFRKKKNEALGKGTDRTVNLTKIIDVLNCTPVGFGDTATYSDFLTNAEKIFKEKLDKMNVTSAENDLFDYYIDAFTDEMKNSGKEQFIYKMQMISRYKGLIDGEKLTAKNDRADLADDLAKIEKDIDRYEKLKERLNIH